MIEQQSGARILADGKPLAGKKHKMVRPPEMLKQTTEALDVSTGEKTRELTVEVIPGGE